MKWKWKMIGAGVGALLGGPWGAGIGGFVGHWLDRNGEANDIKPGDAVAALVCVFLSRMAADTGLLNAQTRERIIAIAKDEAEQAGVVSLNLKAKIDGWAKDDALFWGNTSLASQDAGIRTLLISCAFRLACSGKSPNLNELNWIREIGYEMGLTDDDLNINALPFIRHHGRKKDSIQARGILGVSPEATQEEIKERYREMSRRYHPDKHASADEALRELASERFAAISSAYSQLVSKESVELFGVSTEKTDIVVPETKDIVRCFFCTQKCRLPDLSHLNTARCPACQRLLLFERDHALIFIEVFRAVLEEKKKLPRKQPRARAKAATKKKSTKRKTANAKTGAKVKSKASSKRQKPSPRKARSRKKTTRKKSVMKKK